MRNLTRRTALLGAGAFAGGYLAQRYAAHLPSYDGVTWITRFIHTMAKTHDFHLVRQHVHDAPFRIVR